MRKHNYILAILLLAFADSAYARNTCSQAQIRDGDRWAWLSRRDERASISRHLPWGQPVDDSHADDQKLVILTDYVNLFDTNLLIPVWSAERVQARGLGHANRNDCFRPHPRVPQSDLDTDYDEPDYDQGHLSPAEDQSTSMRAMVNSFFYTNMTPQYGRFNRGLWKRLEDATRGWARQVGTVFVISGSVLDRDEDGRRDPDSAAEHTEPRNGNAGRVAVPSAFYKIIAYPRANGAVHTLSILLPHNQERHVARDGARYLRDHVTTVATIERLTGLDLFPNAPRLEEATDLCDFAGGSPSLCRGH